MKIAAITLTSTSDKPRNLANVERLVRAAAQAGAEWVQIPEMFAFHGPYSRVYEMAEMADGPTNAKLSALAKELRIVLIAGTAGERADADHLPPEKLLNAAGDKRVYNTSYIFGRDGALLAKYRKTHLFNLRHADGKPHYCESDGYLEGDAPKTVTIEGWRVGMSICYDLRFSQYYDLLAKDGDPDIILVPSAFTKGTGMAHWELLLRARAVERQAYVYAANQVGEHSPGKESFGHSMIVDPWGVVLANTGGEEGIALADVSKDRIAEVRGKLPALANRRPGLYAR